MIEQIQLDNFKRFRRFSVKAGPGNILVGPNNSGKSSTLDALRVLDACIRHSRRNRPMMIDTERGVFDGYHVPDSVLPFDLANVAHNYDYADARLTFRHANGAEAVVWLHPNRPVRFIVDNNGKRFSTAGAFRAAFPVDFVIVPPLAPLEEREILVQPATVQRNKTTRLAARTFRNIWHLESHEDFERFRERVERAWPGIKLNPPELVRETKPRIEMFFQEDRIDREIHWAGFGFQVWLQIHTHLIRATNKSILVLDEPDIYLHPELQHQLYWDVKGLFSQYFFATHATEIINEADTAEILVVGPSALSAKRIQTDNDYESMLTYLGSAQNADFAKISKAKRVVFVEGNDSQVLRRMARTLNLEVLSSDQKSPIFQLGGFSQWRRAENTVWAFKKILGVEIEVYCLFDRDYRTIKESEEFRERLSNNGVKCHVLLRKEIENYLLVPEAIARAAMSRIRRKSKDNEAIVNPKEVKKLIFRHAGEQKTQVSAHVLANAVRYEKEKSSSLDESSVLKAALSAFEFAWQKHDGRVELCPGKEVLKDTLSSIGQTYGISLSSKTISAELRKSELDPEIASLLNELNEFLSTDAETF